MTQQNIFYSPYFLRIFLDGRLSDSDKYRSSILKSRNLDFTPELIFSVIKMRNGWEKIIEQLNKCYPVYKTNLNRHNRFKLQGTFALAPSGLICIYFLSSYFLLSAHFTPIKSFWCIWILCKTLRTSQILTNPSGEAMCYPKNVQVNFSKLCEVFSFRILFELLFWGETIWRFIFFTCFNFTAELLVGLIKATSSLLVEADDAE